jgi:predicted GIY-YIG superfamily endonuclease
MADPPTCMWRGLSGKEYQYHVYAIGALFYERPGNYIFAKETVFGSWSARYIGQTENLYKRLGDHEKEACAERYEATHIHAHLTAGEEDIRKAEERDLIRKWNPPCNKQLT